MLFPVSNLFSRPSPVLSSAGAGILGFYFTPDGGGYYVSPSGSLYAPPA